MHWVWKLFACPYCMVHWVALGMTLLFFPRPIEFWWPADMVVSWFAQVYIASRLIGRLLEVYKFPPDDAEPRYTMEEAVAFIKELHKKKTE